MKVSAAIILTVVGLSACGETSGPMVRDIASLPPATTPQIEEKITEGMKGTPRQEIRIGVLLPLSGPDAIIGKALLNASILSVLDSHDQRLLLLPHDTKGTAEGAISAVTALMEQNPDLIIGPLFSHSITAIKGITAKAGVNVIGFSGDYNVAGDGVFLMNFPIKAQVERVIRYASEKGYARFATLTPDTAYGIRALETLSATLTHLNRELTAIEFYSPDSNKLVTPVKNIAHYNERRKNYTREIKFLKNLGEDDDFAQEMLDELKNSETIGNIEFDAILLPEGGALLTTITAWVSYYEIDPAKIKILGTGLWDDEMLFHEPQLYGGWFAAPDHSTSAEFLKRYKNINGETAPRIITLAYDAVALAATLVRQAKVPDFSMEQITNENGFMGSEGLFRFSPDGIIERGLAIYEVTSDDFIIIDPAPTNFIDKDKADELIINEPESLKPVSLKPESAEEDHLKAAAQAALPASDDRPFPYNPVPKDVENMVDQ